MSSKYHLSLTVQYADERLKQTLTRPLLRRWVQLALQQDAEITLRIVGTEEAQCLNREFRGKDYATNVLTFPYESPDFGIDDIIVPHELADKDRQADQAIARADIVLCTEVLLREAQEQHKTLLEHAAHLVIHGTLHAQGYDHIEDDEAEIMESREIELLAKLGFANPYADDQI